MARYLLFAIAGRALRLLLKMLNPRVDSSGEKHRKRTESDAPYFSGLPFGELNRQRVRYPLKRAGCAPRF